MRTDGDIAIVGAGYVGLTSAACFCEMGHRVRLVEVDPHRLSLIRAGTCPIFEQGLPEMLRRHLGDRLAVYDDLAAAVSGARAVFVCVGTPPKPSGAPDLRALSALVSDLALLELADTVIVLKSTVPPGTNRMVYEALGQRVPVVSNPEFLREGTAVWDFFHPDRVVVGSPDAEAALGVAGLYTGIDAPLLVTGWEEAELVKYATNAFLAIKISFANEMAALCEALGAEAPDVLKGLGLDHRVGAQFLRPGPGYGGSCLPKDIKGLAWRARRSGVKLDLLAAAERANARVRERLMERLARELGGLAGVTIAVWGLAFKAGTDDLRGAAAVDMVPRLLGAGARVRAYDPAAAENFARLFPLEEHAGLTIAGDQWEALHGADALLILTEWEAFVAPPLEIRRHLGGRVVVDSRNLLDPDQAASVGLIYRGTGRGRLGRG